MKESDLEFVPVTRVGFTGEVWEVLHRGAHVAMVAERAVSVPPYLVAWPDGREVKVDDRDAVIDALLGGKA